MVPKSVSILACQILINLRCVSSSTPLVLALCTWRDRRCRRRYSRCCLEEDRRETSDQGNYWDQFRLWMRVWIRGWVSHGVLSVFFFLQHRKHPDDRWSGEGPFPFPTDFHDISGKIFTLYFIHRCLWFQAAELVTLNLSDYENNMRSVRLYLEERLKVSFCSDKEKCFHC